MAELTQTEIETKIADIDAKIATITGALAGGTAAAQYTSYSVGSLSASGNQQLEQLLEARKVYQELLDKFPKETADVMTYDIAIHGDDDSELQGDE